MPDRKTRFLMIVKLTAGILFGKAKDQVPLKYPNVWRVDFVAKNFKFSMTNTTTNLIRALVEEDDGTHPAPGR